MVKSVLGVNHQGLTDWIGQRLSAIIITLYSLWLVAYFLFHQDLSFAEWHSLFARTSVKIATLIFMLSLIFHAWIGVWTIITDYIKPFVLRCIVNVAVLLTLLACFLWSVMILWSV